MTKPNFIMIGAMKCGTSSVSGYLENHPDVFMPHRFEPNFFSDDAVFAKGTDWYEAHFAQDTPRRLCGEGSNDYTSGQRFPKTAERMAHYNPEMKLLYIVRHPIDRLVSAWIQSRADGGHHIPPTLDGAVLERADLFVDQSLYHRNLARFEAVFPKEQIFVGFMEDLKTDKDLFYTRIAHFLGLEHIPENDPGQVNPSTGKRVLSPGYTKIKRLPLVGSMVTTLPGPVKSYVKRNFLTAQIDTRPQLSPKVLKTALNEIEADARAFLRAHGKPDDFWVFDKN